MSDEISIFDTAKEKVPMQSDEASADVPENSIEAGAEPPHDLPMKPTEVPASQKDDPDASFPTENIPVQRTSLPHSSNIPEMETHLDIVKMESDSEGMPDEKIFDHDVKSEIDDFADDNISADIKSEIEGLIEDLEEREIKRGIKRRASALSDSGDVEFLGFEYIKQDEVAVEYSQILERLEEEVSVASQSYTPLRYVTAMPRPPRALKRPRTDTDGSRPSSAQSSRSEDDNPSASPASRGRRPTTEISSPLLRIPLERGWKRELVYRAALDAYSRRNADIYYYTPAGKKLRSTREVSENLSGTGLTLENFSFFKESLGINDPDKEIIRDAKIMGRRDSPISSPAPLDSKRTPKPKPPRVASPETTPKSPPAKLKVKSVGSRLSAPASTSSPKERIKKPSPTPPTPAATPTPTPAAAPATPAENNNTAAWKKPRAPEPPGPEPAPHPAPGPPADATPPVARAPSTPDVPEVPKPRIDVAPPKPRVVPPVPVKAVTPPPQPAQEMSSPDLQSPRRVVQPCSLSCGSGVPSLSCRACLCLYHPVCGGYLPTMSKESFLCKNCRKSSPPPAPLPQPRRVPANKGNSERRVTLRMKMSGGSDGSRVWAVAAPRGPPAPRAAPVAPRGPLVPPSAAALPQSLALINGKRFIVVPRPAPLPAAGHDLSTRGRLSNGTGPVIAAVAGTPRRRGRPRNDDTDHFNAFYNKAEANKYNVVVQIFQYLGMRDLAHCARVCKLWRQLAATPALWRHVRMKNSHVSDWGGLCGVLKRHGTKWLDLRKMLLPQADAVFWEQFAHHIATVDTLERLELCRCPASAVEAAARSLSGLRSLSALAIKDGMLDPSPLGTPTQLRELRLKSLAGLALSADLSALGKLHHLQHLSLTSIKELGWVACDVIGTLSNLESLELGECSFKAEFAGVVSKLTRLRRLRLERGTAHCAAHNILRALATLPALTRLELVNVDVKVGFDDALAECKNIQRLLIIPTYVSQSATTNKQVLSGVLRLKESLTHLMWGVTIELLRVTELFIDQCSAGGGARRELGECIPVLKPVPGCRLPMDHQLVAGPPQVEILPLPTLQRLLSSQLPHTKLKLLRIPFHATWRQSLADFQ